MILRRLSQSLREQNWTAILIEFVLLVLGFVMRLADDLDLTGLWGFQYALTCSRPRLDAFGGCAHVIDLGARRSVGWTNTQEWLAAALNGEDVDA